MLWPKTGKSGVKCVIEVYLAVHSNVAPDWGEPEQAPH